MPAALQASIDSASRTEPPGWIAAVSPASRAGSTQTIWWCRSMLEVLDARADWPRREMLSELRLLSTDLVRSLRLSEEEL